MRCNVLQENSSDPFFFSFLNPRTERLLAAPIVPTLARLSAPGVLLVAFQSAVSIGDTYFVGRLGTAPLAGLALVFPLIMLLQMTSAGAMGGGVSSAISRALGAGDARSARRPAVHAPGVAVAPGGAVPPRPRPRARAAPRPPRRPRLVVHALVIAVAMGAAFTVLVLALGPFIYR